MTVYTIKAKKNVYTNIYFIKHIRHKTYFLSAFTDGEHFSIAICRIPLSSNLGCVENQKTRLS